MRAPAHKNSPFDAPWGGFADRSKAVTGD